MTGPCAAWRAKRIMRDNVKVPRSKEPGLMKRPPAGAGLSLTMRTLRRLVRKINHPNVEGYAKADCFPFWRSMFSR